MNKIMIAAALPALALAAPLPAQAAERRFTITQFDRIQVDGPFNVTVATGRPTSAIATGEPQALDRVSVKVEGRVLRVKASRSGWGGYPGEGGGPVSIAVSTHELRGAALTGSGKLGIDKAQAMRFDLTLAGSGQLELADLEADALILGLVGSGRISVGGTAKTLKASVQGNGDLAADTLVAEDAQLNAATSGTIGLGVKREAKVISTGAGDIAIIGSPACTVKASGAGRVRCGN